MGRPAVTVTAWADLRAQFLEAQAHQCAICRDPLASEDAQLDHCHRSGFIRGVLCVGCNTRLGWYEAQRQGIETYLARAAEYIARPRRPTQRTRVVRIGDATCTAHVGPAPAPSLLTHDA